MRIRHLFMRYKDENKVITEYLEALEALEALEKTNSTLSTLQTETTLLNILSYITAITAETFSIDYTPDYQYSDTSKQAIIGRYILTYDIEREFIALDYIEDHLDVPFHFDHIIKP